MNKGNPEVERCECGKYVLERWCGTYSDHLGSHRRDVCKLDALHQDPPEIAAARLAGARAMQEAAARACEERIPSLRRSAASALSNGREVVARCRESDVETCERIAAAIRGIVPEDVVKEAKP